MMIILMSSMHAVVSGLKLTITFMVAAFIGFGSSAILVTILILRLVSVDPWLHVLVVSSRVT